MNFVEGVRMVRPWRECVLSRKYEELPGARAVSPGCPPPPLLRIIGPLERPPLAHARIESPQFTRHLTRSNRSLESATELEKQIGNGIVRTDHARPSRRVRIFGSHLGPLITVRIEAPNRAELGAKC